MQIPAATYRIQFNPAFGFAAARQIVTYLAELGISDLYASPIFQARQGSTHGYDVVNPNQINPELGGEAEFDRLSQTLQQHSMGWLQDIVPNHMAYDSQNLFLMDVLENGADSEYINYFDIEWEHPYGDIKGRVLTPLLGNFYANCLENGEIQLKYDELGFSVNYYGLRIPLNLKSCSRLLTHDLGRLSQALGRKHPDFIKLLGVLYMVKNIPTETTGKQRQDQSAFVKSILWELYRDNDNIKEFIEQNLAIFNGQTGKPESFNLLDNLLNDQYFRLSFWKVGAEELNYRRFFTVNELICLNIDDIKVFHQTHDLIFRLVKAGKINHLRIDHIDGLYDPARYLQRLRETAGDVHIVVEKILEHGELLPPRWPIQGTSGYEFLNQVNGLFCQGDHEAKFSEIYIDFTGLRTPYEELVIDKKRLIADKNLAGDVENLARLLKQVAGQSRYGRDFTLNGLKRAILEILVLFPIYRTYIDDQGISQGDRAYVQEVIRKAKAQIPLLVNELNFIEKILLLEYGDHLTEAEKQQWRYFVMRLQQFSGPLMAKGIEDTLFYVYNRLLSLNEVGGTPSQFGVTAAEFHQFNQQQQAQWPHSLNATATHDTKRSEDMRARLNVLSEIPAEWGMQVQTWRELNQDQKVFVNGQLIPDENDEYFLYQTLVGAFPFGAIAHSADYATFIKRIQDYVVKAVREAKIRTAWLYPDSDYEEGFVQFVEEILQPSPQNLFLQQFHPFQQRIAFYGQFNSLAQVLLKLTAPGVPDFYQGTELWDLSLVDPDNRRPVDFEQRSRLLRYIKQQTRTDMDALLKDLSAYWQDGRIKLFLTAQALTARRQYIEVFQKGDYVPLEASGSQADHIIAFGRRYDQTIAIAIVPRFLSKLVEPETFPLGDAVWGDTHLPIPAAWPHQWVDAITQQPVGGTGAIAIGHALQQFPVALLIGQVSE